MPSMSPYIETLDSETFQRRVDREVVEHEFIDRLFYFWDVGCYGALSFQVTFKSPVSLVVF